MSGSRIITKLLNMIGKLSKYKTIVMSLAVIVVFITTYLLILPAFTLEKSEAEEQGCIDLPATSTSVDSTDETNADAEVMPAGDVEDDNSDDQTESPSKESGDKDLTDKEEQTVDAEDEKSESDSEKTEDSKEDKNKLIYDGDGFKITVSDPDKVLPADTEIAVTEIAEDDEDYQGYYDDALNAVREQGAGIIEDLAFARFYDISFISEGNEIEPEDGSVNVSISYDIKDRSNSGAKSLKISDENNIHIVHFAEDKKTGEITAELIDKDSIELDIKKKQLSEASFDTDSFSVYAIVDAPETPVSEGGLNGKSYGIINNQDTVAGYALATNARNNNTQLGTKSLVVRTEPVQRTGNVFVAANSSIQMWNFISSGGDKYQISTVVNGNLKYLRISDGALTLVSADQLDEYCNITVTEGTGSYAGKYSFSVGNNGLKKASNSGFSSDAFKASDANFWMNLGELSTLNDDDFVTYTATKVSVSDTVNVPDGAQIVIYTRIWNEQTLKYEYYMIDYDGMLVRAYESGDTISWVGTKINTMLWDFTEYHDDNGNITNYYEMQNRYSRKYLAPQVTGGGFLSNNKIGLNLNGRRNGEYYTKIIAWDNPYYDYASIRANNGELQTVPMSLADDFYFAVMTPVDEDDTLETVSTIDHNPFGITLKMQNYGNINSINRSQDQVDVLGNTPYNQWTGSPGLLNKNMGDNGYPVVKSNSKSLYELYDEAMTVNQQFLLTTYEETGYFEFDSTQNFAHLITSTEDKWYGKPNKTGGTYGIGDFVIYDQLGTTDEGNKDTLKHGQFLPYNDIAASVDEDGNATPVAVSTKYKNEMDIHAKPLSSLDPRKDEELYSIPYQMGKDSTDGYVDHFFGMEMSANFMQSENGLDAWGHDLIFEFSGDDDFWLYVDDMLVLDLGGIHSALDGSINFRTGKVIVNGRNTDLRTLYKEAYKENHPSASDTEVNEWLDTIFKNGGTVFKDYSGHSMRMFYMERGAGASNIHMRFNLAPYTKGEVQLAKEVTGTENIQYTDANFPFQIWVKDKERPDEAFVLFKDPTRVTDLDTKQPVPYEETASIGGKTYESVYYLNAGQTVSILLPSEDTEYYIKECGLDHNTYDPVYVNRSDEPVPPTADTAADSIIYKDYSIEDTTVANRKKVIFDNHVKQGSLKSVDITKRVWADAEMTHEWTDDTTPFRFRLYVGKRNGEYTVYSFGKYYVKNRDGEYCIYNNGFVSTGKTDISELDTTVPPGEFKSELDKATFYTSQGGAADMIPAGYTVEIPDLIDGTPFKAEERGYEVPAGYELLGYDYDYDIRSGSDHEHVHNNDNYGVISSTVDDPHITVNNRRGYGIIVNKKWSDAPFMDSHDPIYFAVYLKDPQSGELTLLEDTVRQMSHPATSNTWFFAELAEGRTLNDYLVYEVKLTVPEGESVVIDPATGKVSGYSDIEKVEENGKIIVGGIANDHGYSEDYEYTASYDRKFLTEQEISEDVKYRTDNVSDSRAGIRIVKTDMEGNALAGAVFTLEKAESSPDSPSNKKRFTSDETGLIAMAYLELDETYILTENSSPDNYISLLDSMTIKVHKSENGKYTVYVNDSPDSPQGPSAAYDIKQVENPDVVNMPVITVRNKPYEFKAIKVDTSGDPVEGAEFWVFAEQEDYYNPGQVIPNYVPMEGFESLITGSDGLIPNIDSDHLKPGAYYLREKNPPEGYKKITTDIHFKITEKGRISILNASEVSPKIAEVETVDDGNSITYILKVKNTPMKTVSLLKKSYEMVNGKNIIMDGVSFELYNIGQIDLENGQPKPGETPALSGRTDENGVLDLKVLHENTSYYLYETETWEGYNLLTEPIIITVTNQRITAMLGTSQLDVKKLPNIGDQERYQITAYNSPGVELPKTGGIGTTIFYVLGSILVIVGAIYFISRRRMR